MTTARIRSIHLHPGFTTLELLVVISVIAILSSMLMPAVQGIRKLMKIKTTRATLSQMAVALDTYMQDTGRYPFDDIDLDDPQAKGLAEAAGAPVLPSSSDYMLEVFDGDSFKDGPRAPYLDIKESMFLSQDEWKAVYNPDVASHISMVDPWGNAFRYRQNRSRAYKRGLPFMIESLDDPTIVNCIYNPESYDIWSAGPDGIDGTIDDIGNW